MTVKELNSKSLFPAPRVIPMSPEVTRRLPPPVGPLIEVPVPVRLKVTVIPLKELVVKLGESKESVALSKVTTPPVLFANAVATRGVKVPTVRVLASVIPPVPELKVPLASTALFWIPGVVVSWSKVDSSYTPLRVTAAWEFVARRPRATSASVFDFFIMCAVF